MTANVDGSLSHDVLGRIFLSARSQNAWTPQTVAERLLREMYDLAKWGPTSTNANPARFVFVASEEAKGRLAPLVSRSNREKTLAAPVTAIIGYDLAFARFIPQLFPHNPGAEAWFGRPEVAEATAFRNGTLQGAYLMLAARALGLDCGPISGFDEAAVDREFFAGTQTRSNFLCSMGYGDKRALFPRLPRFAFDEVCSIV